jgi:hypothetical protein
MSWQQDSFQASFRAFARPDCVTEMAIPAEAQDQKDRQTRLEKAPESFIGRNAGLLDWKRK